MEKFPASRAGAPKAFYESPLGKFEVVELRSISRSDVASGDRAFIHTESGNRYMLRPSKSRGGELIIYNEREGGFGADNGHPFATPTGTIATVGETFEYFKITDEANKMGFKANSSKVTRIEVRRGLEAAVAKAAAEAGGNQGPSFGGMSEMMKQEVRGRRTGPVGGAE